MAEADQGPRVERRPLVLVAEDDPDMRDLIESVLGGDGFYTVGVADGQAALEYLEQARARDDLPALLITDVRMPRCEGIDLLAYATKLCRVPTVVITAFGDPETFGEADELGAACCFDKPFDLDNLCRVARRLVKTQS